MAIFARAPGPVLSPCIGVCRLLADGLCEGCHRSGDEIARWVEYSHEERARLMDDELPRRAQGRFPR